MGWDEEKNCIPSLAVRSRGPVQRFGQRPSKSQSAALGIRGADGIVGIPGAEGLLIESGENGEP